jgi:SAM-dependent methyltransferase
VEHQLTYWRRVAIVGILLPAGSCAAAAVAPARYVRFAEVRPILTELAAALPPELAALTEAQLEARWPAWIEQHDRSVRARLAQGDEDTIVNWLLFGTSFTAQPRALMGAVEAGGAADQQAVLRRTVELISARLDDLITALVTPGTDERRLFARRFLEQQGFEFETAAGRQAARDQLLGAIMRVGREQEQIDQELGATSGGDSLVEFVQRSRLFRTRGLSLDTSLLPNYAIEQSLAAMKAQGLLKAGAVRRVAIVGPGLDFADKDVGFDFYPQQTLQPFAVLDSLQRLGLVPASGDHEIVLLDISPRVIDHVARARTRAAKAEGYTLRVPLARTTEWLPEVRKYWEVFGDRIGAPAPAAVPKAISDQAEVRAVQATPAAVQRMSVVDLNIVTERLDREAGDAFDLVIATNVFIYYDVLEQALALANIEAMLAPGAFLLANFAAPQVRTLTIRPVDTHTTVYGKAQNGAESLLEFLVWYRARAN